MYGNVGTIAEEYAAVVSASKIIVFQSFVVGILQDVKAEGLRGLGVAQPLAVGDGRDGGAVVRDLEDGVCGWNGDGYGGVRL